jgi:hypothetical protein
MGYRIDAGQKCLYIWAPQKARQTKTATINEKRGDKDHEDHEDHEMQDDHQEEAASQTTRTSFVLVPVFGDCQLARVDKRTGESFPPLPSFLPTFPEDRSATYSCLIKAAEWLGCSVREMLLPRGIYGSNARQNISIDQELDSTNKIGILAHELAHSLLHWGPDRSTYSTKAKERHAEATAEVIRRYLGIQNDTGARDYLLTFGVKPLELLEDLEIIAYAATTIIQALQHVVGFTSPLDAAKAAYISGSNKQRRINYERKIR